MSTFEEDPDSLLLACEAMLRELAGYPITRQRLAAARPLIAEIVAAIRTLDEVDLTDVEPATVFRAQP